MTIKLQQKFQKILKRVLSQKNKRRGRGGERTETEERTQKGIHFMAAADEQKTRGKELIISDPVNPTL